MKIKKSELKEFLDTKVIKYNTTDFIATDPIQIPHKYRQKEDIEISGFLTATIAWGNRKSIITNANKLMDILGNNPHDFVMSYNIDKHASLFEGFVHRTFNSVDATYFIQALQHMYNKYGSLEAFFETHKNLERINDAIHHFKNEFFSIPHPARTKKHVGDPFKNSSCKRINMWLRWNCRKDNNGVDFGIWNSISPSKLSCPLDVHTGNIARKLGILKRKQNDAKALLELDLELRKLDPIDPVKYDFALFGLGAFEDF